MLNRRSAITAVGAAGAAIAVGTTLPRGGTRPTATAHDHHRSATASSPLEGVTRFTTPMPILPVHHPVRRSHDTDFYVSVARPARSEIVPGMLTEVLTYDGVLGGRVIHAQAGRRVVVLQRNASDRPISVHLHGGVTPSRYDGAPDDLVLPGEHKVYVYANEQPAAFLWRHDHVHPQHHHDGGAGHVPGHGENVYRGMASPYVIKDRDETALGLPSGKYEIPLVLRDHAIDGSGQLVYTMDDAAGRSILSVNGAAWPVLEVSARKYRFRILNASNLRFFALALSDNAPFTQIGGDVGLLPAPFRTPVVVLSPGERSDVIVDFSSIAPGTEITLRNYAAAPAAPEADVLRFVVGDPVEDESVVPSTLPAVAEPPRPTVRRTIELGTDASGQGFINGLVFDPGRIDTQVQFGTTEEWTIRNVDPYRIHNFHTHLAHFRVLTRNGNPVGPDEAGWKDTVQVLAGQEVVLRMTFDRHRGKYTYHCHFLDHSDMGMMANLQVV